MIRFSAPMMRPANGGRTHYQLAVFVACFLLLILRLPESLIRAEFWAEDGLFFGNALSHGALSIAEPYAGYFVVGIRAVSVIETLGPATHAPLVGNALALAVMAAVASFATSPRMPWDRFTGLLIALGVVLQPIGFELVGTMIHVVWPLTLWMAFVALSKEPHSALGRRAETVGLVLAGLTGLGAVLVAPMFLRGPRRRLWVVGIVAGVQVATLIVLGSERPVPAPPDWALVPFVWLLRAVQTPLIGDWLVRAIPMAAVVVLSVMILSSTYLLLGRARGGVGAFLGISLVLVPLLGIIVGGEPTPALLNPAWAPRYFWLAGVGFVILLAVNRNRLVAMPVIALLLVGVSLEFRIQPAPERGWVDLSRCIGGPVQCEIPVAPDDKWNVVWAP